MKFKEFFLATLMIVFNADIFHGLTKINNDNTRTKHNMNVQNQQTK